jgi:hypothetical protein
MLTRRDMLRLLLATSIAQTVDVERLLWVPKSIVVVPAGISFDAINEIVIRQVMPVVIDSFFKTTPFLAMLQQRAA